MQRLFVYGTLRRECAGSMFDSLVDDATFVGHARARGRLFDLGDYPGILCGADETGWVVGEVFSLGDPESTLSRLDDYEGCGPGHAEPHEFERIEREVILGSGESSLVWIYAYLGPTAGRREIESGDYCDDLR